MEKTIQQNLSTLKSNFEKGALRDIDDRLKLLNHLEQKIREHEDEIYDALKVDLNKTRTETLMTELALVYDEIQHMKKHLKSYAKPDKPHPGLNQIPGSLEVRHEPYGVVLIMSPWNYPLNLSLIPLIDAFAAGNLCYLKPSVDAPATSQVLRIILRDLIDQGLVFITEGGREANTALLEQPFDYFFFTGSPKVGKVVMDAAAKFPAPCTLELGGKSPTIIDRSADLDLAAKRILFGKLLNSGQTCVAPDYVCVHQECIDAFLKALDRHLEEAIPNVDYFLENIPKIVNQKHYERLAHLIQQMDILDLGKKQKLYPKSQQIYPCFALSTWDDLIMQDEIFGPILPILAWTDEAQLFAEIKKKPKPLALYLFSEDEDFIERALTQLPSGGVTIQDTILHMASPNAPFGGVGNAGFGAYHGEAGFRTFTQDRTILKKWKAPDIPWRHHPFEEKDYNILNKLLT